MSVSEALSLLEERFHGSGLCKLIAVIDALGPSVSNLGDASKKQMFLGNVTGRHSIWNHLQPPTKNTTTQIWTSVLETWRKHEPITVQARKHYLAGSFQASPKPARERIHVTKSIGMYDFPIISLNCIWFPHNVFLNQIFPRIPAQFISGVAIRDPT